MDNNEEKIVKPEYTLDSFYKYKRRKKSTEPHRIMKITIRLYYKEYETLQRRVKKSGLSLSTFVRKCVFEKPPREGMPYDTIMAFRGLYGVISQLEEMQRIAKTFNYINKEKLEKTCDYLEKYLEDARETWIN